MEQNRLNILTVIPCLNEQGRIGAVVIGGLNPPAILEELGVRVVSRALSGLLEFNRLFPYEELPSRI